MSGPPPQVQYFLSEVRAFMFKSLRPLFAHSIPGLELFVDTPAVAMSLLMLVMYGFRALVNSTKSGALFSFAANTLAVLLTV